MRGILLYVWIIYETHIVYGNKYMKDNFPRCEATIYSLFYRLWQIEKNRKKRKKNPEKKVWE